MKQLFYLLFFIFFISLPAFAGDPPGDAEYKLFELEGKQGLKDDEGNVLISAKYDELGWSKGGFHVSNQAIGYRAGDRWGIITLHDRVVTEARYTRLYPATGGMLVAATLHQTSLQHRYGIITVEGKTIIPLKYVAVKPAGLRVIVTGRQGKKFVSGVLDLDNRVVIPLGYNDISFLGNMRFSVVNEDGKAALFSDKGKQLTSFDRDSIGNFRNGYAITCNNHLRGLINIDGIEVVPVGRKEFNISPDGVTAREFNSWYAVSDDNKVITSFRYDQVESFGKGVRRVEANGKTWLIDDYEQALTPQNYDGITVLDNGLVSFRIGSGIGILNSDFEEVLPARFDSVFLTDDLLCLRENIHGRNVWSLYDRFGVRKSRYHYEGIGDRSRYLYPVRRNGHWGFVNRSGEEVVHCVYDEVSPYVGGLAVVNFHKEYGIIDKTGEWVVLPQKSPLKVIDSKYYLQFNGRLTTLKDIEKGTVYFTENPVEIKENYLLEHLADGKVWKIDFQGRIVTPVVSGDRYEEVRPPSEGFYAVKIDGKYGFIDAENRLRVANRYDEVGSFSEGLAAISLMGRWGFIDKAERLVIQPLYKNNSVFKNGLAIVANEKGAGLIDVTGKQVCALEYDNITRLANGRFIAQKGDKYGLISETGKVIINVKYQELRDLDNGFAVVKLFGKYGLVSTHGVDIIPVMYDQLIYDEANESYLAMKKSEWESVRLP